MTEQSIPVTVPAQGKSRLLILGVGTAILIAVFTHCVAPERQI